MGITVEELNNKYKEEDPIWDFSLFPVWLSKHGIPDSDEAPIIRLTLQQVFLEFSLETLPEKHHDFDRAVLQMAELNKVKLSEAIGKVIEVSTQESLKKYDSDWYDKSKVKKIWEVIRGKD